ncbi:MAG: response regulator transcription factor [Lyngbya sp. HA4199-MV5]|jgi:DNA-binding NarL/FixJ family response regulator|nr:response regulator transcription factor [Lyngbya sp. HA4199-MV5]
MTQAQPIRILLADDHPPLRKGLALILDNEDDMTIVAEAGNGREAVALFRQHQPDVALIDLRMPQLSGVETITAIRAEFPNARLIVLTTYDGDEDIYQGLRAGAMAYLLKDTGCDEIIETIRVVHSGQRRIPSAVGVKLLERMGTADLSDREREVLQLLAVGKSNQEIGADLSISEATVKFHLNNILNKLNVRDRTQAVVKALRRGLVHIVDAP